MANTNEGLFVLGVQIQGIAEEIKNLERLAEAADRTAAKMKNLGAAGGTASKVAFLDDFEKGFKKVSDLTKKLESAFERQAQSVSKITQGYRQAIAAAEELAKKSAAAGNAGADGMNKVNKKTNEFNGLMGIAISKIIRYRIAFGIWSQIVESMRAAVDVTIEMNQIMANLRKVMSPVTADFQFLTDVAFDLGRRFGASARDVAVSMQVWAQQGKNMVEVAKLTEANLLAMNSANLTTVEAVEALTAATKAYNIDAADATIIADKWMAVQARHAVTAQDLANAIKAIGPAAAAAGVDMDQLNGVVAAIGSVTRKTGREVANSFKTMLARLNRGPAIDAFQALGVAVRATSGEMRPVANILEDLAGKWDSLSKVQKSNIAITVGGIRRYTDFIVLMENFQEFVDATSDSFNALGDAQAGAQEQVKTFASRIQRIQTAFEELGTALGSTVIGDFLDTFAGGIESFADGVKYAGPVVIALTKFFGSLTAIVGSSYLGFLLLRTTIVGAIKLFSSLAKGVSNTIGIFTAFNRTTTTMASGITGISTAASRAAVAIGAIGGIVTGIIAATSLIYSLTAATDDLARTFDEISDKQQGQAASLQRARDEYKQNVDFIRKLITEREKFIQQGKETPGVADAESFANAKLIDTYGDMIKQQGLFFKLAEDGTVTYDVSLANMTRALDVAESKFNTAHQTMVENVTTFKQKTEEQYAAVSKSFQRTKEIFDKVTAEGLSTADLLQPQTSGPQALQLAGKNEFKAFWKQAKEDLVAAAGESGIEKAVGEAVTRQVNDAFSKFQNQQINIAQFRDALVSAIGQLQQEASADLIATGQVIDKFNNQLLGITKTSPFVADSLFYVVAEGGKLVEKLNELRKSTQLFTRDNESIGRFLTKAGLGFDTTAASVEFYRNQLQELFKLRESSEVDIALQEQKVKFLELQNVTDEELQKEQEKLSLLKRERDAVSSNYNEYVKRQRTIENTLAVQLKELEAAAKIGEAENVAAKERATALKAAASEQIKANEESFRSALKNSGAYGQIVGRIYEVNAALKRSVDLQVEHLRSIFNEEEAIRAVTSGLQIQLQSAQLRQAPEVTLLNLQLEQVKAQKDWLRERETILASDTDKIKNEKDIQKLLTEEEKLQAAINALVEKRAILLDQSSITVELGRQQAITDVITAQLSAQTNSKSKILLLEKERVKATAQIEEIARANLELGLNDESSIKRREALALRLLDIEKRILIERINATKEYKDSLNQVATEIQSIFSAGFGSVSDKQVAAYNEIGDLQQKIADAERERSIALKDGNEEGLFDAELKLKELYDRQSELNSATYAWKEALSEVGGQLATLANQKLSEQLVDNLFGLSFGNDTKNLGTVLAQGIVIKPALADFSLAGEDIANRLSFAMTDSGTFAGDYMYKSIIAGATDSGLAAPNSGAKTAVTAAVSAAGGVNNVGEAIQGVPDDLSKSIKTSTKSGAEEMKDALLTSGEQNASYMKKALEAGTLLLANQLGTLLGGGGQGANIGSTIANGVLLALSGGNPILGALGAIGGGLIGGLFDNRKDVTNKPIFDASKSNPLPVSVEKFGENQTILHDISVAVDANFLDASQLDPIAIRNLAQRVREETESLLRRENIWR